MSNKTYTSTIISWKSEQGYGFIENPNGGSDLFLHINDIKGKREPQAGDSVSFKLRRTRHGKLATTNAQLLKWNLQSIVTWKLTILIAAIPFLLSVASIHRSVIPLILYSAMSILSFLMYKDDKQRAQQERWRIPDNSMHFAQLLWGWPGALIAQRLYFHKARKKAFQGTLRFILFVHLIAWIDYLVLDHLILNMIISLLELVAQT